MCRGGESREIAKYVNVRYIEIKIWFLREQNANGMHKIRFHQCAISWPDRNVAKLGWEDRERNETERNLGNVYEKKGQKF